MCAYVINNNQGFINVFSQNAQSIFAINDMLKYVTKGQGLRISLQHVNLKTRIDALVADTRRTSRKKTNKLIAKSSVWEQLCDVADPVSGGSAGFIEFSEAYSLYTPAILKVSPTRNISGIHY